jgi:gamma-glutamyltranspeptidase/glutathione hydrolase
MSRDPSPAFNTIPAAAGDDTEPAHTTHVSVADRWGGVVALTQSVGPNMGSKVATPGLGFLYAATMGYLGELEAGTRRHWSSQSPLLVVRDGRPVLVLGGAGARRIISAVVETVSRFIDEELPIDEALAAPRFHPVPSRIDVEVRPGAAWSEADQERLRTLGFTVRARDDAPYFARVNVAGWDVAGSRWTGVADPRWPGAAGAVAR